ncbi:UDP-glucuronate decarboxylase [Natronincola peptidivorans]|uniref:UDP-glucuronate decarboxylase n=1 Tax=Natronincola peptidivorans TaxID=426128 RepID=A0A1H9YTH4_9FIRM|nr:NAD-dependent epimerase/dehydratase family protein [Natronincola peptidivorans]SES72466.1 UDP-glucuronate decarboxylase [Natronincola peptidivorans]
MTKINSIIIEDVEAVYNEMKHTLRLIEGSTWLISGGAGFLGSYFLDLLNYCNNNVFYSPCKVICIENYLSGIPQRIKHLEHNKHIEIINADIVKTIEVSCDIDYIVHAASIASPTFYRKYPIETIEANVLGLKNLLDLGRIKNIKSFLSFSTSEIYGGPTKENIPTPENYNGNVSCTGPRACYDESKRLGETLAVNYYRQYHLPVKIVRPFNIYGPGLKLDDKRVIPDFCSDALYTKKISLFSDGLPTRSFCYVRDALAGFMAILLSDHHGEAFNIGNDEREISMIDLAKLIAQMVGGVEIEYKKSNEADYLTDNPQRRCPDLTKAKSLLNYDPKVGLEEGLLRSIKWYQKNYGL